MKEVNVKELRNRLGEYLKELPLVVTKNGKAVAVITEYADGPIRVDPPEPMEKIRKEIVPMESKVEARPSEVPVYSFFKDKQRKLIGS